jgi:hypothetical protein
MSNYSEVLIGTFNSKLKFEIKTGLFGDVIEIRPLADLTKLFPA